MRRIPLGRSGLDVSLWCLGTMTFGSQTPEDDAHRQIDMALDAGIDFLDTAEAYPVNPMAAETQGRTEEFIGSWLEKTGRRGDVVIATKHAGAGPAYMHDGAGMSPESIPRAIEASLKRMRTDVIDLYQFHWPNRGSYHFRQNWHYDPSGQDRDATLGHMEACLEVLQREVERGRIRAFGLSNESAWGTTRWIDVAERMGGPRVASIQNEYSLLCRLYDTDLAEVGVNEDVTLLAFSPLAAGYLTGKYAGGAVPAGSRMAINDRMGGRATPRVHEATQAYLDIAARHGLHPVQMAMAWQTTRPFPNCPIFGATTAEQLQVILDGADVVLSQEVLTEIEEAHRRHPMPY
ncbi:MAG: aldo/keto reductase [Shimia sp.]